jgi:hypothetical protein
MHHSLKLWHHTLCVHCALRLTAGLARNVPDQDFWNKFDNVKISVLRPNVSAQNTEKSTFVDHHVTAYACHFSLHSVPSV